MTLPSNLSFETAGASAGLAANWTRTAVSGASDIGQYDSGRYEHFAWLSGYRLSGRVALDTTAGNAESFVWHPDYIFGAQEDGNLTAGVYDGIQVQRFASWTSALADYRFAAREPGDVTDGTYDGSPAQRFESWTLSQADYRTTRDPGDVTDATYSAGAPAERFVGVIDTTFTVTPTTDDLSATKLPAVGAVVNVSSDGTLASPFVAGAAYHVVYSSGSVFRLSDSVGGLPITVLSSGSGTHSLTADTAYCWSYTD